MQEPCAVCYVTFEKFLSNEAFSISGKLLCDMILDAVQGVLQPYILVLNDYSALVVFSQKELDCRPDQSRSARKKAVQPLHHVPVLRPGYAISGKSS